jgi:uncharacterized protein
MNTKEMNTKEMNKEVTVAEITKWTNKMNDRLTLVKPTKRGESMFTNMKAYISDSQHFLGRGDLVRSFEAIVWAWAILEICIELEVFEESTQTKTQ